MPAVQRLADRVGDEPLHLHAAPGAV